MGTHVTVADINTEMLAVGRTRADEQGLDVTFIEGNAEKLPLPDRAFDAVTIAFGIRNVPRIDAALAEAHRVLRIGGRFLCLEFSNVDVPGLDQAYDLYSFNVIPAIGRAVTGDAEAYRYLVEVDPQVSEARRIRRDDARGLLPPRVAPAADRRRGRHPLRLAVVADRCDLLRRPSHPSRPRRLRAGARGRVRADRSGAVAAAGAHRAQAGAADRAADQRRRRYTGSPPR